MANITVTLKGEGLNQLEDHIKKLANTAKWGIEVGWPEGTDPEVLHRAWQMEFTDRRRGPQYRGWAVMRHTMLQMMGGFALQLAREMGEGVSGARVWDVLGRMWKQALLANIENVDTPPLKDITVELKAGRMARGEIPPGDPGKVWVETGETIAAVDYRRVRQEDLR